MEEELLDFLVIGHRGCAGLEPENTLRSVRRAIALGCPMVEIDVRLLGSHLVVLHDASLDRTTNAQGALVDWEFEQLRQVDAGCGEQIPTLAEVLDACAGRCALNVEIKGSGCVPGVLEELRGWRGELLVSSFDWSQLEELRGLDANIPLAVLVDSADQMAAALKTARQLGAVAVNLALEILAEDWVAQVHALGMRCYVFTVKSTAGLDRVIAAGADGCFADDPASTLEHLRKLRQ